jgi:hypothetical protein
VLKNPPTTPVAVKGATVTEERTTPAEAFRGSASRTEEGTMNVLALGGAKQDAEASLRQALSAQLFRSISMA